MYSPGTVKPVTFVVVVLFGLAITATEPLGSDKNLHSDVTSPGIAALPAVNIADGVVIHTS